MSYTGTYVQRYTLYRQRTYVTVAHTYVTDALNFTYMMILCMSRALLLWCAVGVHAYGLLYRTTGRTSVSLSMQGSMMPWRRPTDRVSSSSSSTRLDAAAAEAGTQTLAPPSSPFSDPDVTISFKGAFRGIWKDMQRRRPFYASDWTDGLRRKKTLAAATFLYFACLAPVIAFGGLVSTITRGQMGVIEFLLSCGSSGVVYALFSGQPMTFLGPTGLTLAFISALYRFTQSHALPFLPLYACTGLWTALFVCLTAVFNLSNLMR